MACCPGTLKSMTLSSRGTSDWQTPWIAGTQLEAFDLRRFLLVAFLGRCVIGCAVRTIFRDSCDGAAGACAMDNFRVVHGRAPDQEELQMELAVDAQEFDLLFNERDVPAVVTFGGMESGSDDDCGMDGDGAVK